MPRTEQDDVAQAVVDQRHAAQNERAHEDFTEFRVLATSARKSSLLISRNSPGSVTRPRTRQRRPEIIVISPVNCAGLMFHNQALAMQIGLDDFHASGEQTKKGHRCRPARTDVSRARLSSPCLRDGCD